MWVWLHIYILFQNFLNTFSGLSKQTQAEALLLGQSLQTKEHFGVTEWVAFLSFNVCFQEEGKAVPSYFWRQCSGHSLPELQSSCGGSHVNPHVILFPRPSLGLFPFLYFFCFNFAYFWGLWAHAISPFSPKDSQRFLHSPLFSSTQSARSLTFSPCLFIEKER